MPPVLRGHDPLITVISVGTSTDLAALNADLLERARLIAFVTPEIVSQNTLARLGYGAFNFTLVRPAIPDGRPHILRVTSGQRSSARRSTSWSNRSMLARSLTSRCFPFQPAFQSLVWRGWPTPTWRSHSGEWQNRWRRIRRRHQLFRSNGAVGSILAAPIERSATFLSTFPRMNSTGASGCSAAIICTASSFAPCCRRVGKPRPSITVASLGNV
jgi:hypothetical protein